MIVIKFLPQILWGFFCVFMISNNWKIVENENTYKSRKDFKIVLIGLFILNINFWFGGFYDVFFE